MNSSLSAKWK
jgi:hypothetical protein